jgi:hypothetical protein
MRAPGSAFAAAIDVVRARYDPGYEDPFFDHICLCKNAPPPRTAGDYTEFVGSLLRAWLVAHVLPLQAMIERRLREERMRHILAPLFRELGVPNFECPSGAKGLREISDLEWIDAPDSNLPPRRDRFTTADLGIHWRRPCHM